MLADAEMEVFPTRASGLKVARTVESQSGLVRRTKITAAAEKPGDVLGKHIQYFCRCVPSREAFGVGRERGEIAVPPGWQLPALHQVNLGCEFGVLRSIRVDQLGPFSSGFRAACADASLKVLVDTFRHQELCIFGPSIAALAQADLIVTQRLAMGSGRVLFMRGAIADVAV